MTKMYHFSYPLTNHFKFYCWLAHFGFDLVSFRISTSSFAVFCILSFDIELCSWTWILYFESRLILCNRLCYFLEDMLSLFILECSSLRCRVWLGFVARFSSQWRCWYRVVWCCLSGLMYCKKYIEDIILTL